MRARRLLTRVGQYVLVVWIALTVNFALPRLAPGEPIQYLLGDQASNLTPAEHSAVLARYGLDRPWPEHYARYLSGVATGDLGRSVRFGRPVAEVVVERLPWTLLLVGGGTVASILLALAAGTMAAWRRGRRLDVALLTGAVALDSMPGFWIGMVLVSVFAVGLRWLPSFGAVGSTGGGLVEAGRRLLLPAATIVLATVGSGFLLVRGAMIGALGEGYVLMARAKGLRPLRIVLRHALRNAMLPLSTSFALSIGAIVSGAVVVETVFAYPGIGRLLYEATLARDYPLLQGGFLLVALGVLGANLAADLLQPLLDPRLRRRGFPEHRREPFHA